MIEFIVWTRKFVGFGDISNDVRTKTENLKTIYFIVFFIGHHQILQNYEFHSFRIQVDCVIKCAVKVE